MIAPPPGHVLDVVAVVSNPVRYESRYRLFREFARRMAAEPLVRLSVVEVAHGDRAHECAEAGNPRHLRLRTRDELWHKEQMVNLGIARLPDDWRYVAWVDADVTFARHDWAAETIQQLQHHPWVQLFSDGMDLGPDGAPFNRCKSFGYSHVHRVPRLAGSGYAGGAPPGGDRSVAYWHHPGYAWASTRGAIDAVGGLFDLAIVGEADYLMARSIVGDMDGVFYPGTSPAYKAAWAAWGERARALRGDIGYVAGTLLHHWHGPKAGRRYWDRKRILVESRYDPALHLARDHQGLYRLADRGDAASLVLRDKIRAYFRSRNEDSVDPEPR